MCVYPFPLTQVSWCTCALACSPLQHLKQRGNTHPIDVQITKHVDPREAAKAQIAETRTSVIASAQEKRLKKNRAVAKQMVKAGLLEKPVPIWKRLAAGRAAASKVSVSQASVASDRTIAQVPGLNTQDTSRPSHRDDGAENMVSAAVLSGEDTDDVRSAEAATVEASATGVGSDGSANGTFGDEETGNASVHHPREPSELVELDQSLETITLKTNTPSRANVRAPRTSGTKQAQHAPKRVTFKHAGERVRAINVAKTALGPKDKERVKIPAVPRPFVSSVVPVAVAVGIGLFGIWMIFGLAANLGPENTKVWLIAAATSFVTKMFLIQPARVCGSAVVLKCADKFHSARLEQITRAIEDNTTV